LQNCLFHCCEYQSDLNSHQRRLPDSRGDDDLIPGDEGREQVKGEYGEGQLSVIEHGEIAGIRASTHIRSIGSLRQMRINTQPSSIRLRKPPQNIFCSLVDIRST
jgi:hypothetical protein